MATIAPAAQARRVDEQSEATTPNKQNGQEAPSLTLAHESPAPSWTPAEASSYLATCPYLPKSVAGNCLALEVDGSALLKFDAEAWRELAQPDTISSISIAKITSELGKLSRASAVQVDSAATAAFKNRNDDQLEADVGFEKRSDALKFFASKTFEGGAEHTRQWFPCTANANIDGAQTKAHVLRFLGMYNVVDLLTFTIGMQFLLEEKKEMHSESGFIENYFDLFVAAICALSCVLSGTGMTVSTIIYNSASAVHEVNMQAFVKSTGVTKALTFVNDASIWGFNFLCMGCVLTALKFAWSDNKLESSFDITRAVLLTLPVIYLFFLLAARIEPSVGYTTHYALYAGLMSDVEVIPDKETTGWAGRWAADDVGDFLDAVCKANMSYPEAKPWQAFKKNGMEERILKKYASVSEAHRPSEEHHEAGLEAILGAVSSSGFAKTGAVKKKIKRRSFNQVQLTPGDGGM
mmetsp:Transcript_960/g.1718  ORF Transcript_960/g.1718 Transcript_960/m.1718 type:complete len:465 (+) Transcript_960:229-1623(+)